MLEKQEINYINYPLTEFQKSFWHIENDKKQKSNPLIYTAAYHYVGHVDIERLKFAIFLATNFCSPNVCSSVVKAGGKIHGVILLDKKVELEYIDMKDNYIDVESFINGFRKNPEANLSDGRLMVFKLVQTKPSEYVLLVQMHHFIFDGAALLKCIERISFYYNMPSRDGVYQPSIQQEKIENYLLFQNKCTAQEKIYNWDEYAREVNANSESHITVYASGDNRVKEIFYRLPLDKVKALKAMLRKNQSTISIFYMITLALIFFKISGRSKCVIEVPINIRKYANTECYGNHLNPFPMLVEIDENLSLIENLINLTKKVKELKQDFKYIDSIYQNRYIKQYYVSKNPRVLVNQSMRSVPKIMLNDTDSKLMFAGSFGSAVDIHFDYEEDEFGINLQLLYKKNKLSTAQVEYIFKQVVEMSELLDERQPLVIKDYRCGHAIIHGKSVLVQHDYFDKIFYENFKKCRKNIVYKNSQSEILYENLEKIVRSHIKNFSIYSSENTSRPLFLLYIEDVFSIFAIILALLKAKLPLVIVHKKEPASRLRYYIDDSEASFVLSDTPFLESGMPDLTMVQEKRENNIYAYQKNDRHAKSKEINDDIAYIAYTSGSTGNPKGIMVSYANLNNVLHYFSDKFDHGPGGLYLILSSPGFDIFILEILLPFTCKAALLEPLHEKSNFVDLGRFIDKFKPCFAQTTPSHWKYIVSEIKTHRNFSILTGGEPIDDELKKSLLKLSRDVYNVYGPTETTIWSTCDLLSSNKLPEISCPINNTQLFILNKNNEPVPAGFSGELFIAGAGVSRGYLESALNSNKFIQLSLFIDGKIEKINGFKTGDIVDLGLQGEIFYQGREDGVVKLNGVRIDLNGVRSALRSISFIADAYIIMHEEKQYLVAFVILRDQSKNKQASLFRLLNDILPLYLVPSEFVFLKKFPLTMTKKIDKKSLARSLSNNDVSKSSNSDCEIYNIISQSLGLRAVDEKTSFFEQGGTSLKAMLLSSELLGKLSVHISHIEIFEATNISTLIAMIKMKRPDCFHKHVALPRDRYEITILACIENVLSRKIPYTLDKVTLSKDVFLQILALATKYFGSISFSQDWAALNSVSSMSDALRSSAPDLKSPIVPFRLSNTSQTYMIFVHGLGGNVWRYAELSQLITSDINVIGLESPGLSSSARPHKCMEALVSHYIQAIQSLGPKKIIILGWCMGAIIADELLPHVVKFCKDAKVIYINPSPPSVLSPDKVKQSSAYSSLVALIKKSFLENIESYNNNNFDSSSRELNSLAAMALAIKDIYKNRAYLNDNNFIFYYKNSYFYRMLTIHYFNLKMLATRNKTTFNVQLGKYLFLTKNCFSHLEVSDKKLVAYLKKHDRLEGITMLPGNHFTAVHGESAKIIAQFLNQIDP